MFWQQFCPLEYNQRKFILMRLKNKKVLVYGLGDSGRAVIKVLRNHDAYVSFYDDNIKYFEYVGFERNPQNKQYDFVVVSPGIKCIGNKLLAEFEKKNIPVISEIDFAYLLCKGKVIAVTGTNGKTTVCMLTHKILKTAGYETFLCGNIGLPFSAICEKTTKKSVVVCEVSNFQLECSKYFRADVSCVLNIKPDHLDRHGSFEEYKKTKSKIAQNLKHKDVLILNLDDENAKMISNFKHTQYFSKNKMKKGIYVCKDQIYVNKKPVLKTENITLKGEKNLENVLACVSICSHFRVTPNDMARAVSSFSPADHRMQIVGVVGGVKYVDDSKSTNVASTVACVEAFKNESLILLMGGLGKDIDYAELFSLNFPIKEVICFGEDREKINESAQKYAYRTAIFEKLADAVRYSKRIAEEKDCVLLSPACASFDEFSSYAERGEIFKSLIFEDMK